MNDLVYSSASESRTRDKITRRYTLDDQLRTRGHAECSILRDANTADFSISIDGATAMQWQCVNLINDSEQYQFLIFFRGQYEGNIELTINKSKPGEVCLIPNSKRFSEIRKVGRRLDSSCFRAVSNGAELSFSVAGDYSIARMAECFLSLLSLGLFRPKNHDFLTGVDLRDLTPSESESLILINVTIRMLFTAFDFSSTS